MVVSCPSCQRQYRLEADSIRGERVLLRCPHCQHWFSVLVASPAEESVVAAGVEPDTPASSLPEEATTVADSPAAETAEAPETAPVRVAPLKLLVADEPSRLRQRLLAALQPLQPEPELLVVDDGEAAIAALQHFTPDLAVVGTALDKVYCFQVCEYLREHEHLRQTRVVFLSELHPAAAHCGEPESLHGADAWLNDRISDEELRSALQQQIEALQAQPAASE